MSILSFTHVLLPPNLCIVFCLGELPSSNHVIENYLPWSDTSFSPAVYLRSISIHQCLLFPVTVLRSIPPVSRLSLPSWGQPCDGHAALRWQWSTASSPDRLPSVPLTVCTILSWGKRRLILTSPLQMMQNLCLTTQFHLQKAKSAFKTAPLSPARQCHPRKQVDQMCHCHSATIYSGKKKMSKQTPGRSEWQQHTLNKRNGHNRVTKMSVSTTVQLKATVNVWEKLLCCQVLRI